LDAPAEALAGRPGAAPTNTTRPTQANSLEAAIVSAGHKDAVLVQCHAVDDGVVARKVAQEHALRQRPLANGVGTPREEGELAVVRDQRAHRLLVVREHRAHLARDQIPQLQGAVTQR